VALPALTNLNGGLDVESTASIDCSIFRSEVGTIVQGPFLCRTSANISGNDYSMSIFPSSSLSATISATANPISTNSNTSYVYPKNFASQSNLWTGVKVGLGVVLPLAALVILGVIFLLIRKRLRFRLEVMKAEDQRSVMDGEEGDRDISHPKEAELGQGGHWEKTELPVIERPTEAVHMERDFEWQRNSDVHELHMQIGFKSQPNSGIYELDAE